MTEVGLATDLKQIAVVEAARAKTPMAVVSLETVALGLPDGGALAMPASMAREAAEALLYVVDARVDGVSCQMCRHALFCSQLSGIRRALTLRDYLHEGGEDGILQAVAAACQLFEADAGRYNGETAPKAGE